MKKAHYQLIINQGKEAKKHYTYSFGNTKNIEIHIVSGRALISFSQSAVHLPEQIESGEDKLCSDAIKKAMLLHLILYANPLEVQELQLSTDGNIIDIYRKGNAYEQAEKTEYSMD